MNKQTRIPTNTKGSGPHAGSQSSPPPPASKPMSSVGLGGNKPIPPVGSGPPKSKVGF